MLDLRWKILRMYFNERCMQMLEILNNVYAFNALYVNFCNLYIYQINLTIKQLIETSCLSCVQIIKMP